MQDRKKYNPNQSRETLIEVINSYSKDASLPETVRLLLEFASVAVEQTSKNADSMSALHKLITRRLDESSSSPMNSAEKDMVMRLLGAAHEAADNVEIAANRLEGLLPRMFDTVYKHKSVEE